MFSRGFSNILKKTSLKLFWLLASVNLLTQTTSKVKKYYFKLLIDRRHQHQHCQKLNAFPQIRTPPISPGLPLFRGFCPNDLIKEYFSWDGDYLIIFLFFIYHIFYIIIFYLFGDFLIIQKQPPEVLYKKGVLENIAIFTGKYLCWSIFLIKLETVRRPSEL